MKKIVQLTVNGETVELAAEPHRTLLELLREELGLFGTKNGCGEGACGACTVLVGGRPRLACLTLPLEVEGAEILTIEGLTPRGTLHPLQQAFAELGAVQCGFCTPGMILAAEALLRRNPRPSEQEILEGLSGNLCRCTGYTKIVEAVRSAAEALAAGVSVETACEQGGLR